MDRLKIIAANVNENLAVHTLLSFNNGFRSKIGDWIVEGDEWIIENGVKVQISKCLFNQMEINYTRAPQTITTKSVEIPKPISVLPEMGETVFCSYSSMKELNDSWVVLEHYSEHINTLLKRGRLHLTAEAAIAHSKADIEAVGGVWE